MQSLRMRLVSRMQLTLHQVYLTSSGPDPSDQEEGVGLQTTCITCRLNHCKANILNYQKPVKMSFLGGVAKEAVVQGAKAVSQAAVKTATKQVKKSTMNATKYIKKKVKSAAKTAVRTAMEEFSAHPGTRDALITQLVEATGASRDELSRLDDQELADLANTTIDHD